MRNKKLMAVNLAQLKLLTSKKSISSNIIHLNLGQLNIELNASGAITIGNSNAKLQLMANGDIKIVGLNIQQLSQHNIHLNADQHIHLNSPIDEES